MQVELHGGGEVLVLLDGSLHRLHRGGELNVGQGRLLVGGRGEWTESEPHVSEAFMNVQESRGNISKTERENGNITVVSSYVVCRGKPCSQTWVSSHGILSVTTLACLVHAKGADSI